MPAMAVLKKHELGTGIHALNTCSLTYCNVIYMELPLKTIVKCRLCPVFDLAGLLNYLYI